MNPYATILASISLYYRISKELLPTPAKSHYTFNLRDLSKVFQGMTMGDPDFIKTAPDYIRLWAHECFRVFSDRLIDEPDREWFKAALADIVKQEFKQDWTKNFDGTVDETRRVLKGAADDFSSFINRQLTISYQEGAWHTWAVRK